MGTETYPKNGRSRQSFGGDHHKVLQTHQEPIHKVEAPASNDTPAKIKGEAWNIRKNKPSAC